MTLKGVETANPQHGSDRREVFCRLRLGQRETQPCNSAGVSDRLHPSHELAVGRLTRARQNKSPAVWALLRKQFSPKMFMAGLHTGMKPPPLTGKHCWETALRAEMCCLCSQPVV